MQCHYYSLYLQEPLLEWKKAALAACRNATAGQIKLDSGTHVAIAESRTLKLEGSQQPATE